MIFVVSPTFDYLLIKLRALKYTILTGSLFISFLIILYPSFSTAQPNYFKDFSFTEADSLRGGLNDARTCYDVHYYVLDLSVEPRKKFISGSVEVHYNVLEDFEEIQLDLYDNMEIHSVEFNGDVLSYRRLYNAFFVEFPEKQLTGTSGMVKINYSGNPTVAKNPPWDGGFVWSKDKNGDDWIGVACEGDGASLWWPNKDHLSEEPDSMRIICEVPAGLTCVANGQLEKEEREDDAKSRFHWFVSYPINNYNVTLNIANYSHFSDVYYAEDETTLDLDYYVLPYNINKAREHFKQVPPVIKCFENFLGKYPFWDDGFALVETPYLGMEHQGAIAYGNNYLPGYLGNSAPGFDFDYIIVHETGHEWFGNAVSCYDLGDMWIHESFTTYLEAIYIECLYGYQRSIDYLMATRMFISNDLPIVGPKHVNYEHKTTSDHYYKGAWMLHTLRNTLPEAIDWQQLLKSFYDKHMIGHARTSDFVHFVNDYTGIDYTSFFKQYLHHPKRPILEYQLSRKGKKTILKCRWNADVRSFDMPVKVGLKENYTRIIPTTEFQEFEFKNLTEEEFTIATELFYIRTRKVNN